MSESSHQITRRDILKRGAIVGGSVLWVTPMIQTLGMTRALAAEPSDLQASYRLILSVNPALANPGNVPVIRIENTSAPSVELTDLKITIGDTAFNFDYVRGEINGALVGSTNIQPGYVNNDQPPDGPDFLRYTFSGFAPTEWFQFEADIDPDGPGIIGDFRTILFSNGGAPNSQITVKFNNGKVLTQAMPDAALQPSYAFSQAG